MGLKDDDNSSPTVEDLILQLRSSFFSAEFQQVAKTLMEREQRIKEEYLKLKTKVEQEKYVLFAENSKLSVELKKKEEEIVAMKKLVDEYERKLRVYENLSEKKVKGFMGSSFNLENMELKECAAERCRPPGFAEKKDSKRKSEPKLPEIINIDDDDDQGKCVTNEIKREHNADDDGLEFISSIKRRRAPKEIKREHHDRSAKISPVLEKTELDTFEPDSGSDTEEIGKAYMFSIAKVKKPKLGWKSESDMVKDFEKDDELCLNGVCALHRQRIIVHGADISILSTLACKLIDGDPQNELKKKASELNRLDLEYCRTFAKKYSLQLFNIYQNKSDPFFPTTRSQEIRLDD